MVWNRTTGNISGCQYTEGKRMSPSGTLYDVIYDTPKMTDQKGHYSKFNNELQFHRTGNGVVLNLSGGSVAFDKIPPEQSYKVIFQIVQ